MNKIIEEAVTYHRENKDQLKGISYALQNNLRDDLRPIYTALNKQEYASLTSEKLMNYYAGVSDLHNIDPEKMEKLFPKKDLEKFYNPKIEGEIEKSEIIETRKYDNKNVKDFWNYILDSWLIDQESLSISHMLKFKKKFKNTDNVAFNYKFAQSFFPQTSDSIRDDVSIGHIKEICNMLQKTFRVTINNQLTQYATIAENATFHYDFKKTIEDFLIKHNIYLGFKTFYQDIIFNRDPNTGIIYVITPLYFAWRVEFGNIPPDAKKKLNVANSYPREHVFAEGLKKFGFIKDFTIKK